MSYTLWASTSDHADQEHIIIIVYDFRLLVMQYYIYYPTMCYNLDSVDGFMILDLFASIFSWEKLENTPPWYPPQSSLSRHVFSIIIASFFMKLQVGVSLCVFSRKPGFVNPTFFLPHRQKTS